MGQNMGQRRLALVADLRVLSQVSQVARRLGFLSPRRGHGAKCYYPLLLFQLFIFSRDIGTPGTGR